MSTVQPPDFGKIYLDTLERYKTTWLNRLMFAASERYREAAHRDAMNRTQLARAEYKKQLIEHSGG